MFNNLSEIESIQKKNFSDSKLQWLPKKKVESYSIDIKGYSIDWLVKRGLEHIINTGEEISSRSGSALQSYNVNYFLLNPKNRIHTIRSKSLKYFARELLAYFKGSLYVNDGLVQASKFWSNLADEHGCINSNYGYYVFYSPMPNDKDKNQYEWVVNRLKENVYSRRAIMNINQAFHKNNTKDFPCTICLLFFIRRNQLICEVYSRSTDIITGLPYDMGFFSFLTELVYIDLVESKYPNLQLGYTSMKTTFTQLYFKHRGSVKDIFDNFSCDGDIMMPPINKAQTVLQDIYNNTYSTDVMQWIYKSAEL